MLVYVDFIEACYQLEHKPKDENELREEIERIYHKHIKSHAVDKIFFDDMGALKLEIEIKLEKAVFHHSFYQKPVQYCLEKIAQPFNVYLNEREDFS